MMDALSDYEFYEKGLVSQPVCAVNHIQPFLEKRPEKLWGYYCTGQYVDVTNRFIVQPGLPNQNPGYADVQIPAGWIPALGLQLLQCRTFHLPDRPHIAVRMQQGAFPSGDPFLVYPGADKEPEESLRIMLMDEAMSDLCAMNYLEELAGRDVVMKCIEPEGGEKVEFESYPRSIAYLVEMRKKVNREIEKRVK